MSDERDVARKLLPPHLSGLVGRHVEGSVDVIAHLEHDCPSDSVGEMREFESTDGSLAIRWCEACEWHKIERRSGF